MKEAGLRKKVIEMLASMDAVPVENGARPGTPDVNITTGWIELKKMEKWPARDTTALRVEHFSPQQKIWIARRERAGGRVWVLLQVGTDYLLLKGGVAVNLLGSSPKEVLEAAAIRRWERRLVGEELKECVS